MHKSKYKYMNIGLIQVAIKPLTRIGLNTSCLSYVRDKRHESFRDSLIGTVEASLHDGPAFFNCFPNFTISLHDPGAFEAITLGIHTKGFNMKPQ